MITTRTDSKKASLIRQVHHWLQAASRLSALDHLASGTAWYGIDPKIAALLRQSLEQSIQEVVQLAQQLVAALNMQGTEEPGTLKRSVIQLRDKYLKAEETVHFYTEALNSRTTPNVAALMRACDILCYRSMEDLLKPLGTEPPPVMTSIVKGIGASILKAGLRLWDGNISPIAVIKVTHHNLFRPTAIIHETGHQVAHILHWNDQLGEALETGLKDYGTQVAKAYRSWSSEIAADAFAFVHCGYASVAALHDVLSGTPASVFGYHAHDPHPISYIRLLLNTEMCRQSYGSGPWDDLQSSFQEDYNLDRSTFSSIPMIRACMAAVPDAVRIILATPLPAFRGRALTHLLPPSRVSPAALAELEQKGGPALFTSHAWIWNECVRILSLNAYKIGLGHEDPAPLYKLQEEWMVRLGFTAGLN